MCVKIILFYREYNDAIDDDLWEGMQKAVQSTGYDQLDGRTVRNIMKTWSDGIGYPVITVERTEGNKIKLSQVMFKTYTTT